MTATITVIGNMTADPELRYSQNGIAIASFTVASTEKVFDRATNEFKDGKTLFMRCSVWREMAEHVSGSLVKGNRVIAVGKIATNEYLDKEGNKRSSIEMTIDSIGPDLRYATAQVTKTARTGSSASAPAADSWAASTPPAAADTWNMDASNSDQEPF